MRVPQTQVEVVQDLVRTKYACNYLERMAYYSEAFIGDYKYSARSQDFHGWLLCDGRTLSRDAYKNLFDIIGTAFGSNNAYDFKLPNFKGRVPGAAGDGPGLSVRSIGETVGEEMHKLVISEMPTHNHNGATGAAGSHDHGGQTGSVYAGNGDVGSIAGLDRAGDNGSHSHSISMEPNHSHTIASQGGDGSHNTMQPTLFAGMLFVFAGVPIELVEQTEPIET